MRPYTVNLEEQEIGSLRRLAAQNDLPPGIYARVLLLRALRHEMEKAEGTRGGSNHLVTERD